MTAERIPAEVESWCDADAEDVIALLRLNDDRIVARHGSDG